MPRDARSLFLDIKLAIDTARQIAGGKSVDELREDVVLRMAVERLLITIGEAVTRLRRDFPAEVERLSSVRDIVATRNLLVHRYEVVELAVVERIVKEDLAVLLDEVMPALLEG